MRISRIDRAPDNGSTSGLHRIEPSVRAQRSLGNASVSNKEEWKLLALWLRSGRAEDLGDSGLDWTLKRPQRE